MEIALNLVHQDNTEMLFSDIFHDCPLKMSLH